MKFQSEFKHFHSRKCIWTCRLENGGHLSRPQWVNALIWSPVASSLTEAFCLFWVSPWGLHLSPVTNIHIIDRVLYCRMAFLSPITENWLWKWYRGIEKILFKTLWCNKMTCHQQPLPAGYSTNPSAGTVYSTRPSAVTVYSTRPSTVTVYSTRQ